jgi:phytoene dehydrogenase-like protein
VSTALAPPRWDAVVVGAGPNGLSAAVTLAMSGLRVVVLEANETLGGGARTDEAAAPGFRSDTCSAIHPLGANSPFLRTLPLSDHGLQWVHPPLPLVHPLDGGQAAVLDRDLLKTAEGLGEDGASYRRMLGPFVNGAAGLLADLLAPLGGFPRHPILMARMGLLSAASAARLCRRFRTPQARALFAGCAAHAIQPLDDLFTAAVGVMLLLTAHAQGWPVARGGSQAISDALAGLLRKLGGEVQVGRRVSSLGDLPPHRVALFNVTPRQLARICGGALSAGYRRSCERYRYGAGSFKLDWALDGPIPWAAEVAGRAGTVHLGGTLEEIAAAEAEVCRGEHPGRPYVLIGQQSLFDGGRAPEGKQVGWGYCHVPNGSTVDMTEAIERQVERFAPGFRDRIIARHVTAPADFEKKNENYIGGDIAGGATDVRQLLIRPFLRMNPYTTPNPSIYLCSSSTPPGAGVHGMCGYYAARTVLRRVFRQSAPPLLR